MDAARERLSALIDIDFKAFSKIAEIVFGIHLHLGRLARCIARGMKVRDL